MLPPRSASHLLGGLSAQRALVQDPVGLAGAARPPQSGACEGDAARALTLVLGGRRELDVQGAGRLRVVEAVAASCLLSEPPTREQRGRSSGQPSKVPSFSIRYL